MSSPATTRSESDLDFPRILERLAHHCRTAPGEVRAARPALSTGVAAVREELEATTQMRSLLDAGHPPPFGGVRDVGPLLDRALKGSTLEPEGLLEIADTARGAWLLRRFLEQRVDEAPRVAAAAEDLPDLEGLHEDLYDRFDDHGALADHASDELQRLRARRRSIHDRIRGRIRSMLHEKGIEEHLMDTYYTIREDRFVLPVRSGERAGVEGIIHGSSHTGATLFIEPAELVTANNELKLCEQEIVVEERRILAELTAEVAARAEPLEISVDTVATLDVLQAKAQLAAELDAHPPTISEDGALRLDAARNPLLALRKVPVVANDIALGQAHRFLVVTGPNAGGKTVTLSTLGLCALMVRCGLHLPCGPDSVIPVFTNVLTLLGDHQDLQADLSTFSGHLVRLQRVLDVADEGSLVLLDELAAGTSVSQGAALAVAVLESLAERGAAGAVTTHFERLKTLSLEDERFTNAAVVMDQERREPTYELRIGLPGSSSGLEMADKMGLPTSIVARAREVLGDPAQDVERSLQRLEAERVSMEAEREELALVRAEIEAERDALKADRARIEAESEALVRATREETLTQLEEAQATIRGLVRELQRDPSAKAAQTRRVKLNELEKAVREEREQPAAADDTLPREGAVVGAAVFVEAFNRDGVITAVKGNKVEVAVGTIRTRVALGALKLPREKAAEARRPARSRVYTSDQTTPPRSIDNTCDVRGHRLDEAVAAVDRFLDNALLANRNAVYVLHGHGTGRLRKGLRDHLRGSPYVSRFERAEEDKGGEAVTRVWLS